MSLPQLQQHLLEQIEIGLERIPVSGLPKSIYEPYRYALSAGGKRIRPLLCLLAAGLCKGRPEDAMPAAIALEVLHNFTLVHDDIMDAADTRRGNSSVHKKWNANIAILSGDIMFADALKQLEIYAVNNAYSKEEYASILKAFIDSAIIVCEGQALDMDFMDTDKIRISDYLTMIEGKTSALISASLKIGAITAHAGHKVQHELYEIGNALGKAFQIQDDLLDVVSDPNKFGKKTGGDIYEGKKTFLSLLALERANREQKQVLDTILGNRNAAESDVNEVIRLYYELSVVEDVKKEVKKYYDKALSLLLTFEENEYRQELEHLFLFLKNRDH